MISFFTRTIFPALFITLIAFSGCREDSTAGASRDAAASKGPRADKSATLNILFIGNSLTYMNDLPGLLEALINDSDEDAAHVESIAFANNGLEDHWPRESTRNAIANGGWDVVILQQGPSATEGRPSLLEYSRIFDEAIKAAGGETALYMVWPSSKRDFDFDGVCASYRMAAEQIKGHLYPVGEAWRLAWARDPELKLYGGDGFHPSRAGTYLAALVMYEQLTGQSPIGLPASVTTTRKHAYRLNPELANLLQEVAADANEKFANP